MKHEKVCPRHAASKPEDVHAENIHKNKSVAAIKERFPDKFPGDKFPDWSYDHDGTLNVVVDGTAQDKKGAADYLAETLPADPLVAMKVGAKPVKVV